jgi:hypothetical protein
MEGKIRRNYEEWRVVSGRAANGLETLIDVVGMGQPYENTGGTV